jgi:RNA polymerase sigma-70 factor (ECF subfamily)
LSRKTRHADDEQPDAGADLARDEALLAAISAGDGLAFDALVRLHLHAIHGYLFRLTGSRADAEDLAQETFLRVWQKAGNYRAGRVKVTTWLHTIAHRLAVDGFRRKRELTATDIAEPIDPHADPAERQAASEQQRLLDQALGELPERQRAAILLCQVQGFSNAQAAEILGIKVRALESLLARARKTLRESLSARGALAYGTRAGI